jgi:hypothetical protein
MKTEFATVALLSCVGVALLMLLRGKLRQDMTCPPQGVPPEG